MSKDNSLKWSEANQRYLLASLKAVQAELEEYKLSRQVGDTITSGFRKQIRERSKVSIEELEKAAAALPTSSNLDRLATVFCLSGFERKIILMCAGVELDASFSSLVASLNGDAANPSPSFSLALAAFPDAHWSAVAPQSPLRYWQLLELNNRALITKSTLKIDESILHYLTGVQYFDEKLAELIEPIIKRNGLAPSQINIREKIVLAYQNKSLSPGLPILLLKGKNSSDNETVAAEVCERIGFHPYSISMDSIPPNNKEILELIRSWNRESALKSCALFLDCSNSIPSDKAMNRALSYFTERIQGLLILSFCEHAPVVKRPKLEVEIPKPTPDEQHQLWCESFNGLAIKVEGSLSNIVKQFNLATHDIHSISNEVNVGQFINEGSNGQDTGRETEWGKVLWRACCHHTRPKLEELIERIEPIATWTDIVLPTSQKQILKEVAIQVKQRNKVYSEWGFSKMGSRGLGISALFAGESGTGKTMASEVLANELNLDLYKIDLSQVVNKYIGETEKNLKRIFDAAEDGGAILLFDEADALFGKRSDVKDSHDRYSNIEVSYLLQRMEAYRGLAILTTNMKSAMDTAFFRRIRFVIHFSYPDQVSRAEIWRRVFPTDTPQKELDFEKLSRLNVPGGNIRNIALNAAFIAAHENSAVQMEHILQAARSEYIKLEKTMSNFEIKEWV